MAIRLQHLDRKVRYRIHEDDPASLVAARLRRSGYPFLRGIECEYRDGVTVLTGCVPTYHLRQIAQSLALHTPGVRKIEDRIHVTNLPYRDKKSAAAGCQPAHCAVD